MKTTDRLSSTEQAQLAREIAIDQRGYRNYGTDAFTDGWDAAREWTRQQLPQSARGVYVSCWLCRGEHEAGAKFCPVLARL